MTVRKEMPRESVFLSAGCPDFLVLMRYSLQMIAAKGGGEQKYSESIDEEAAANGHLPEILALGHFEARRGGW